MPVSELNRRAVDGDYAYCMNIKKASGKHGNLMSFWIFMKTGIARIDADVVLVNVSKTAVSSRSPKHKDEICLLDSCLPGSSMCGRT